MRCPQNSGMNIQHSATGQQDSGWYSKLPHFLLYSVLYWYLVSHSCTSLFQMIMNCGVLRLLKLPSPRPERRALFIILRSQNVNLVQYGLVEHFGLQIPLAAQTKPVMDRIPLTVDAVQLFPLPASLKIAQIEIFPFVQNQVKTSLSVSRNVSISTQQELQIKQDKDNLSTLLHSTTRFSNGI